MSKVVQLVAFQTKVVDSADYWEEGMPVPEADTFVLALTDDGSIYITQNPQYDQETFDASCWQHLDPPPTY